MKENLKLTFNNQLPKFIKNYPTVVSIKLSSVLKRISFIVIIGMQYLRILREKLNLKVLEPAKLKFNHEAKRMITPMQKGIEAAKIKAPPSGVYEGVDLSVLPSYICFKAQSAKEAISLKHQRLILLVLVCLVGGLYRSEVSELTTKLREKEYIIFPDFLPVSPQTVSDEWVKEEIRTMFSKFGNVRPSSIEANYNYLINRMKDSTKSQFEAEMLDKVMFIKENSMREALDCPDIEILEKNGHYKATGVCTKEVYVHSELQLTEKEIIEMDLKLIPPKRGQHSILEIQKLKRFKNHNFKRFDSKGGQQ